MTFLRDFTWDLHKEAETSLFAKKVLRKEATKEEYATYLYNLLAIYDPLEWIASRQGLFKDIEEAKRLKALHEDFKEIDSGAHYQLVPSVVEYHDYLVKLGNDPHRRHLIKAHLYVRHMGDFNGGQTMKRQVSHISSGKFYDIANIEDVKNAIREKLDESLGQEARTAFVYAIRMFKELGGE